MPEDRQIVLASYWQAFCTGNPSSLHRVTRQIRPFAHGNTWPVLAMHVPPCGTVGPQVSAGRQLE